jgi:hypothetical protein
LIFWPTLRRLKSTSGFTAWRSLTENLVGRGDLHAGIAGLDDVLTGTGHRGLAALFAGGGRGLLGGFLDLGDAASPVESAVLPICVTASCVCCVSARRSLADFSAAAAAEPAVASMPSTLSILAWCSASALLTLERLMAA